MYTETTPANVRLIVEWAAGYDTDTDDWDGVHAKGRCNPKPLLSVAAREEEGGYLGSMDQRCGESKEELLARARRAARKTLETNHVEFVIADLTENGGGSNGEAT